MCVILNGGLLDLCKHFFSVPNGFVAANKRVVKERFGFNAVF